MGRVCREGWKWGMGSVFEVGRFLVGLGWGECAGLSECVGFNGFVGG